MRLESKKKYSSAVSANAIWIILVLALLLIVSNSLFDFSVPTLASTDNNYVWHSEPSLGVSLSIPSNWEKTDHKENPFPAIRFISPQSEVILEIIRLAPNDQPYFTSSFSTLEQIVNDVINYDRNILPNYQILDKWHAGTFNGYDYYAITFTTSHEGIYATNYNLISLVGDRLYILVFAVSGQPQDFQKYHSTLSGILDSYQIIPTVGSDILENTQNQQGVNELEDKRLQEEEMEIREREIQERERESEIQEREIQERERESEIQDDE